MLANSKIVCLRVSLAVISDSLHNSKFVCLRISLAVLSGSLHNSKFVCLRVRLPYSLARRLLNSNFVLRLVLVKDDGMPTTKLKLRLTACFR